MLLFGKNFLGNELLDEILGALSFAFSPFVQSWFEESLVVLGHASEGSSSIEEIELFVIFF